LSWVVPGNTLESACLALDFRLRGNERNTFFCADLKFLHPDRTVPQNDPIIVPSAITAASATIAATIATMTISK
jgi:hypothetical protein